MKSKLTLTAFAAVFIFVVGCKAPTAFISPNNLSNITGTLYLKNGKQVSGKLTINTEDYSRGYVKVIPQGDNEDMRYGLPEVTGYETRGSYYALKKIRGRIAFGNDFMFMKRLTPANSRISLYEQLERETTTTGRRYNNSSTTRYVPNYFMQLPTESVDDVWELSSSKFTPNFDEKMSKMVADCPALSSKIANKEDGYFYRQVTAFDEKRVEVLMNIISEYNNCK